MTKKVDQKALRRMKQRRRRMLTLWRMCRYGVNNFSRNAWLTVAATAVMSVTLLIIFTTLSARHVMQQFVADLSDKVDFSIYLASTTTDQDAQQLRDRLVRQPNVKSVRYVSATEARQQFAAQNKQDQETLEAIKEAVNRFPATLRINLHDVNSTTSLDAFIVQDELYQKLRDPAKAPSFAGERRKSIKTITDWIRGASIGGAIATIVFVVISSLVVFNTIRMAIFNRKDEIQMMKLIGAGRSFIRGPFIVEAVMYGFIAAVVATAAGYGLVVVAAEPLTNYGLPMQQLWQALLQYLPLVITAMITVGALIGVVSSWIATRKYLKI